MRVEKKNQEGGPHPPPCGKSCDRIPRRVYSFFCGGLIFEFHDGIFLIIIILEFYGGVVVMVSVSCP